MGFGMFSSQQGNNLKKVLSQPICKGPTVSIHKHIDKPKFRAKSSIRPTPRSSTLMKPTASQLYWLSVGAKPTDSVENMLFRAGLIPPKPMVVVGSKNGQQSTNHHVSPITGEILN
ncbi:unnamed protein product [Eruca vesicaria subsp. sativa]|uniref:Uncharacterized protein n=1 Tax=Eruca vesicaria subsp. sativa TaxID=29727 RepID=A0ABC8KQB2_ERUVS|nr:unnamed protein product [Eruca vesicaria subsp. sativa]